MAQEKGRSLVPPIDKVMSASQAGLRNVIAHAINEIPINSCGGSATIFS